MNKKPEDITPSDILTDQRQLPDGKLYHVFVSYRDSDEDREWVRELIYNLQNRYRFICCDHAIDFEPGRKIIDNIKFAITKSMKTLVILSKEYKDSYWCEFEIEYALLLNMDMREQILIPVLKEECEIPDYLRPFTYIDARDNNVDMWLPKLVSAIESKGQYFNHESVMNRQAQGRGNLEILYEDCSKCNCTGPIFTKYVAHSLNFIESTQFVDIMEQIESCSLVKGRHCRNIWWPTITFFIALELVLGVLGGAMTIPTDGSIPYFDNDIHIAGLIQVLCFSLMVFVWIPICCCTDRKGRKRIKQICIDINRQLITKNIMIVISQTRVKADVKVLFLYYNSQPCLEYIQNALKHKNSDRNFLTELVTIASDTDEVEPLINEGIQTADAVDIAKEEALKTLLELSEPYLQEFLASKLSTATTFRHTNRAMCICQYAESKKLIQPIIEV